MRIVIAMGVLTALLVAACGGDGKATDVSVALKEWSIAASPATVTEGKVKFEVANEGTVPHEFVVVKSDLTPNGLPVENGKVVEGQVNIVDEIEPFGAKTTESIELDLSPGKYLLICNIVETPPGLPVVSHYRNGMVVAFLVEQK